jgi:hypothetical protein
LNRTPIARGCGFALLLLAVSTTASAQWIAVGRKVVGKITTVTQPHDSKSGGYDAATVILDADAGKVYATALDLLKKNAEMTVLKKDDAKLTVAFKRGDQAAQLRITSLGDKLCQLLIVSNAAPGDPGGTPAIVDAVKRICDKLGVKYQVE